MKMKKRLFPLTLVIILFACLCFAASAGSSDNELETVYISTFEELKYQLENGNNIKIVLDCDIEGDEKIVTGEDKTRQEVSAEQKERALVLDLNGFILTVDNYICIKENTFLTICDSGDKGTLKLIGVDLTGMLVIQGGRLENLLNSEYEYKYEYEGFLQAHVHSELVIEGGEVYFQNPFTIGMESIRHYDWQTDKYRYLDETHYTVAAIMVVGGYCEMRGGRITAVGAYSRALSIEAGFVGHYIAHDDHDSLCLCIVFEEFDGHMTLLGGSIYADEKLFWSKSIEASAYTNSRGEIICVDEDTQTLSLPFSDVYWGEWYYDATKALNDLGIMGGYPDGSFGPQNLLTRADFVTLLHRLVETPSSVASTFTDISDEAYYAPAVAWAAENGIVNGTSATEFSPNTSLTREQLVTILYRYRDAKYAESTRTEAFADYAAVSGYAKEAMTWAVENGIVTGKDGLLAPRDAVTRAETAVVLVRFVEAQKY